MFNELLALLATEPLRLSSLKSHCDQLLTGSVEKTSAFQHPYIICVNSTDFYLDDISIEQTLFGTRSEEGFFICNDKPQNTSVSGILLIRGLVPWNLHVLSSSLWHNPWAKYPLPKDTLLTDQHFYEVSNSRPQKNFLPGKSLGEIFRN